MSDHSNGVSRKKEIGPEGVQSPTMKTSEVCLEQRFFDGATPLEAGTRPAHPQSFTTDISGVCPEQTSEDAFTPARLRTDTTCLRPHVIDTSGANPRRQLLNIDDLEEIYGFKRWTIRTYCSQRKLPFVKIGRRVFFDPAAIDAWIKAHARPVKEVQVP